MGVALAVKAVAVAEMEAAAVLGVVTWAATRA